MHARPQFFAKVMGELLFWVGEDKMLFGSDYAIWEPKWQIEGLLDWEMPDESEFVGLPAARRRRQAKILGLNAAKLYGVDVPEELQVPEPAPDPAAAAARRGLRVSLKTRVLAALGTVYDPELDEPITTLGFVGSCVVTEDGDVAVRLRLPTPQCAPNFAFLMAADARAACAGCRRSASCRVVLEDHYTGKEINAALARGDGLRRRFPGETAGLAGRPARAVPAQGAASPARRGSARPCSSDGATPERSRRCASRTSPATPDARARARRCGRRSACPTAPTRRR